MKNIVKKLNIFAFVLVFSFGGLFAHNVNAQPISGYYWDPVTQTMRQIVLGGGGGGNDGGGNGGGNDNFLDVSTLSATNVDEFNATLRGSIDRVTSNQSYERYFLWGTSSGNLNNTLSVSGSTSSTGSFSRNLSGLTPNRTYFFRACAKRVSGTETNCGVIRSFNSSGGGGVIIDDYNPPNPTVNRIVSLSDLVVVTADATNIAQTSVFLNGVLAINRGGSTTSWFEYGTTTALGSKTPNQPVGNSDVKLVTQQISGISSGTTYYFRAVAENSSGRVYGEIKYFTTGRSSGGGGVGASSPNTTSRPAPAPTVSTPTSSVMLSLDIKSNLEKVFIGDVITYTVSYENLSGEDIKNIILRVELPSELRFIRSTMGSYSKSTNSVLVQIESLPKTVKGEFLVIAEVTRKAINQSVIVTALNANYDNPKVTGAKVSETYYSIVEVDGSNVSANSLFAGKFFPTSLWGWLLIILIILVIILIARKCSKDKEKVKEEKQELKIAR